MNKEPERLCNNVEAQLLTLAHSYSGESFPIAINIPRILSKKTKPGELQKSSLARAHMRYVHIGIGSKSDQYDYHSDHENIVLTFKNRDTYVNFCEMVNNITILTNNKCSQTFPYKISEPENPKKPLKKKNMKRVTEDGWTEVVTT